MRGAPVLLLLVGLVAAGCAAEATSPVLPGATPAPAGSAAPDAPLALPALTGAPAPWLERAAKERVRAQTIDDGTGDFTFEDPAVGRRVLRNAGLHTAVVRTATGHLLVDDKRGVLGPVEGPADRLWCGVVGKDTDAILAVARDGTVLRAPDAATAMRAGGLVKVGKAPPAPLWDAAGDLVVGAVDDALYVGDAAGTKFRKIKPLAGSEVVRLHARADGVIAALVVKGEGKPSLMLSKDRGRSFHRSLYTPERLGRVGGLIWNDNRSCPVVLAQDGAQWVRFTGTLPDAGAWVDQLRVAERVVAHPDAPLPLVGFPAAPVAPVAVGAFKNPEADCPQEEAPARARQAPRPAAALPADREASTCQGARCLSTWPLRRPPPATLDARFLEDGRCAAEGGAEACSEGAPLTRTPHVVRVNRERETLEMLALPDGCAPLGLHALPGAAFLFCAGEHDQVAVFAAGTTGALLPEGALALPGGAVSDTAVTMARDGTLAVRFGPPLVASAQAPLRVAVRRPAALGDASAWRVVTATSAVAVRVLPAGTLLEVTSPADAAGARMTLLLDRPGEAATTLFADAAVDRKLRDVDLWEGELTFFSFEPDSSVGRYRASRSGALAPAGDKLGEEAFQKALTGP